MSFKIKKWGCGYTIDVRDLVPGACAIGSPYTAPALAFSWAGMVLFLFYDSAAGNEPCWAYYDPALGTWSAVHRSPAGIAQWLVHSYFQGDSCVYNLFGRDYFYASSGSAGYYYGNGIWFGWDAGLNLVYGSIPSPTTFTPTWIMAFEGGPGLAMDGTPGQLHWMMNAANDPGGQKEAVVCQSFGGGNVLFEGPRGNESIPTAAYMPEMQNSPWLYGVPLGTYVGRSAVTTPPLSEWRVYANYPLWGNYGSPLGVASQRVAPQSYGAGAWLAMHSTADGDYSADPSDPMTPVTLPFTSTWEWRRMRDGLAYALDEGDLDGIGHSIQIPTMDEPSYNAGDGFYTAVTISDGIQPSVWRLDPHQPTGRAVLPHQAGVSAIGWLGDYAIRPNLKVESLLPFPDSRASSGASMPPQERADGYVLGQKEIYRVTGNTLVYHKDLLVGLSGYPTTDEDWSWPGDWVDVNHYAGFWDLFAGESETLIGRMPDSMFGLYEPGGGDVMYGLGKPAQDLIGLATDAFTVTLPNLITATSTFSGPLAGTEQRRMLLSSPDGPARYYFCSSRIQVVTAPIWKALAGNVSGGVWSTVFDLSTITPPVLGQTGWTVWSVVPIKPCRALRQGGYLVGATLYFAPWAEGEWKLVAGSRDATFRDSGQGWVPAKAGAAGPDTCVDWHAPVLLGFADEWGSNRSLYGPDALLVFDANGAFVECLNSYDLYPPDGREILVTRESNPRVIFRVYRHGTYSDYAEAWGQYHALTEDEEIQAPLYACYDLMTSAGTIAPGAGTFRGFLDMHDVGRQSPGADFRWDEVADTLYLSTYPKTQWSPPALSHVRAGRGGLTVTPLSCGPASTRNGVRGVGQRSGAQR